MSQKPEALSYVLPGHTFDVASAPGSDRFDPTTERFVGPNAGRLNDGVERVASKGAGGFSSGREMAAAMREATTKFGHWSRDGELVDRINATPARIRNE